MINKHFVVSIITKKNGKKQRTICANTFEREKDIFILENMRETSIYLVIHT